MVQFVIEMLRVYQMPARAISNSVQSTAVTSRLYHSGYFHLNEVCASSMFALSLSGDSPSANVE